MSSEDDFVQLPTDEEFLDSIIARMMTAPLAVPELIIHSPDVDVFIKPEEVRKICEIATVSLLQQRSLLRIDTSLLPVMVVGDLHGQFRDLRILISRLGDPEKQGYLFLGDYVDRGTQGVETALLLLCLKSRHPSKVFLLRGNHEDCNTTATYGFFDECKQKYGLLGELVWLTIINTFNCLPICALLGERVMCMHGGLSPNIKSLSDIEQINRPTVIPPYGLLCDLLWSDPQTRKSKKGYALSTRGISFSFDESIVESFCATHNIDVIVRAHQINTDMLRGGYKLFDNGRLVTLFSAPNYGNMMNDSTVLKVDQNLTMRFIVFRPEKRKNSLSLVPSELPIELSEE